MLSSSIENNKNLEGIQMTAKITAKPGMPWADTRIAKYLTKQIEVLQPTKSQREIASEMGYDKPNIISMFKRGETKVPLDKIPLLAKALNVDPQHLYRLAFADYAPDLGEAVRSAFGLWHTKNEEKLLQTLRVTTKDLDPEMPAEFLKEFRALAEKHFKAIRR